MVSVRTFPEICSSNAIRLDFYLLLNNNDDTPCFSADMPSSQPIDIPDAKKRNKKKKRCRATDSFSGRFEGTDDYLSSRNTAVTWR